MSIVTETQRLIQAKSDLKNAIEKRGANIPTDNTIDTYANMLDVCPFAVSGTFVPTEDTRTFSLSGLPFVPTSLMLICSSEIASSTSNRTPENILGLNSARELNGFIVYANSTGGSSIATLKSTSSITDWDENGINITLPSSLAVYFKTGLVYNYFVTGGCRE